MRKITQCTHHRCEEDYHDREGSNPIERSLQQQK